MFSEYQSTLPPEPHSDRNGLTSETVDDIRSNTLLAAVMEMEEAFVQLHHRIEAVKETAQIIQRSDTQKILTSKMPWTHSATKGSASLINGDNFQAKVTAAKNIDLEEDGLESLDTQFYDYDTGEGSTLEPEALRQHKSGEGWDKSRDFIKASGFSHSLEGMEEVRMVAEWMELATFSKRALESAASPGNYHSAESFVSMSIQAKRAADAKTMSSSLSKTLSGSHFGQLSITFPMSPSSPHRMTWDMIGGSLLILDSFTLPIMLAWDIDIFSNTASGRILLSLVWISLSFWSLDIVLNFSTGYFEDGTLVLNRLKIMKHYMKTWFLLDVLIVAVDVFSLSAQIETNGFMRHLRGSRVFLRAPRLLRAMRLLRLMQMQRFDIVVEEIAVVTQRQWILLVVSMGKPLISAIVGAHIVACLWYFIGRTVSDSGRISWLERERALEISGAMQYIHALQWMLTPPAPPPIEPGNAEERLCNMFIVVFVLIVMGTALGKFTSALQELSAMNAERTRKRREVRSYLQLHRVKTELTVRIMRFVDYKLSMEHARAALDLSLISATLQMELYVSQRSSFLEPHKLFFLAKELYPVVYATLCGALGQQVFEKDESIFEGGEFATMMVITAGGGYTLLKRDIWEKERRQFRNAQKQEETLETFTGVSGVRWFAESCLFAERMIHQLTLRADIFCDAYTLTSRDLRSVVQDSPACAHMFCEYAKDFIAGLKLCNNPYDNESAVEASKKAIRQNLHYMELYPDPILNIDQFGSMANSTETRSTKSELFRNMETFINQARSGSITDQRELSKHLQDLFFELDPLVGSHVIFTTKEERERSESSCISILNLLADQYKNFTSPQEPSVRLTESQWKDLRDIVQGIAPTPSQIHAVLVLLVIKNLGKSKRLVQQVKGVDTPEHTVMYLINQAKNVVPSVKGIDEGARALLIDTLSIHHTFNLAQFLQGENTPANVQQLREMINGDIIKLKFYILFFLGFMSGVKGGQGSKYMDSKNVGVIIMSCRALHLLTSTPPRALYWSYMTERARKLRIPTRTPEDLALIRLACLSRVQDQASFVELHTSWASISEAARDVLVKHFLADGIKERAMQLIFFPECIGNAKKNPTVRVSTFLEVVVDLLLNLAPAIDIMSQIPKTSMLIEVDLSDMASFISMVKNRFIFESCIMRCKMRLMSFSRIALEMTTDNWSRTSDSESDMMTLAHDMKQMLKRLDHSPSPPQFYEKPRSNARLHCRKQPEIAREDTETRETFFV